MPVFPLVARRYLAAKLMRQQLHAVANAENRPAALEYKAWNLRRSVAIHARGAAGKNEALGIKRLHPLCRDVMRQQLAVDVMLPHPPSNKLTVLRSKVQDRDGITGVGRRGSDEGRAEKRIAPVVRRPSSDARRVRPNLQVSRNF